MPYILYDTFIPKKNCCTECWNRLFILTIYDTLFSVKFDYIYIQNFKSQQNSSCIFISQNFIQLNYFMCFNHALYKSVSSFGPLFLLLAAQYTQLIKCVLSKECLFTNNNCALFVLFYVLNEYVNYVNALQCDNVCVCIKHFLSTDLIIAMK